MVKLIMTKLILPLLLLAGLFLASCENTSEPRFEGDVYTLAALLRAGQPIDLNNPVYVTRSASIEEFDPLDLFVFDATVVVRDLDTGMETTLQPTLHEFKIKYIDPAASPVLPGHRYRVEATVPGYDKLIWAETTVPPEAELVTDLYGTNPLGSGYSLDPDTQNTIPFSHIDTDYPIVVGTGENSGTYNFFVEVYCLEEFSTDLEFTTQVFGIAHPDSSLADIYNAGGAFRRVGYMGRFDSSPVPPLPGNYLIFSNYSYAFALYGRYSVSAYIVDDNYYNYRNLDEGYLHGGVHNALGFLGSASGGKMYVEIVK
jgi:hypothetical protein